MYRYIYIDHSVKTNASIPGTSIKDGSKVLECLAENISKADAIFQKEIGFDVSKKQHIACRIEDVS